MLVHCVFVTCKTSTMCSLMSMHTARLFAYNKSHLFVRMTAFADNQYWGVVVACFQVKLKLLLWPHAMHPVLITMECIVCLYLGHPVHVCFLYDYHNGYVY